MPMKIAHLFLKLLDRFHVPYIDPKHADDTDLQDETYLKTSEIIAAEMFYLFNEVKTLL